MTLLDRRRPFTRGDAAAAGVSPRVLRGSRYRRLFRDVWVCADVPDTHELRAEGGLLVHPPSAWVSHRSAAHVLGLPVDAPDQVELSVARDADRRARAGVVVRVRPPTTMTSQVRRVRVSTGACLLVELATLLPLVELVVVGDAMVRLRMVTPEQLRADLSAASGSGLRLARRAVSLVRARVDSPMETRLRLLMVLAGLPEPVVNPEVVAQGVRFRLDLCYPTIRLAIEYDGRQHRADLRQWDHDIARREWFDRHDWLFVVVVARGIYREPARTLARIATAIAHRGGSVPVLREDWRPHFATR